MTVHYLELADYLAIAAEVTDLDEETVIGVANVGLADSALHAPAAGFGQTELYPEFVDKAAVLVVRLAKNNPLPDGNKRAAWVSLRLFIEINGWSWSRAHRSMTPRRRCSQWPPASGARPRCLGGWAGGWPRRGTSDLGRETTASSGRRRRLQ